MDIKQPPQSIEAEESILASALIDNSADIFDSLGVDDFYKTKHKVLFKSIKYCFKKDKQVDSVSLTNRLKDTGQYDEVGGSSFLKYILESPIVINLDHHIKIIKEKACLRRFIVSCTEAANKAYEGSGLDNLIASHQAELNRIDLIDSGNEYIKISDNVVDTISRYQELENNPNQRGLMSGFVDIDKITSGFQNSDLIIIAGRPSMGKTAFAISCAINISNRRKAGAIFSLEMSNSQLYDRVFGIEGKTNLMRFRSGKFSKENWHRMNKAAETISEWELYLDDTPGLSYQQLRRKARAMKRKHDIKYILVDYMQLMLQGSRDGEQKELSDISRNLKLIAKELDIPVIMLSQLNRELEKRPDPHKRPKLSDLRGSGAMEQDADIIIFLYRDEYYNEDTLEKNVTEINIAKNRNGATGMVRTKWIPSIAKFENLDIKYGDYNG